MLLPFQGARWLGYYKPRVSAHVVRLALGYVLLAFQAVRVDTRDTWRIISGVSQGSRIFLFHANLFNLFNLLFIKYTWDTRDTWRIISGSALRGYVNK